MGEFVAFFPYSGIGIPVTVFHVVLLITSNILVVKEGPTTRVLEKMIRITRSTITGIPIPEFGGKTEESPKLWLLDIDP